MLGMTLVSMPLLSRAADNGCNGMPDDRHDFSAAAGDRVSAQSLHFERAFAGTGKVQVDVCDADLQVVTTPQAKVMTVSVAMRGGSGVKPALDYVQVFRVSDNDAKLTLKFPHEAHARVRVTLPLGASSISEWNLGRGELDFVLAGSAGGREINVGMGTARLDTENSEPYSHLEVNVGLGSFHDTRPGGESGHLTISKEYRGSGQGSLELNVGMGTATIR